MQTHVVELAKKRLSDFFVKEEGHVPHKNALVAGTVATGAILASLMLAPDAAACVVQVECPDQTVCSSPPGCCVDIASDGHEVWYCC